MKSIRLVLCLVALFPVSSCSFDRSNDVVIENKEVEVERSYSEVKNYELLWDSMFDVESNNYYVYIYSITCSHCAEIKNYMIETAIERGDIYFLKATSKDQLTNDPKKAINAENPGDIWILGYPSLLLISNKKCVKNLAGNTQIKTELK